ncbi:MAG: UvrD-helicase domain-containing protein [Candidatus Bipolaricaulota bacterium]
MNKRPRGNQVELIKNTEGLYLVDAGAGTGKTFSISRRYARLLKNGAKPGEIFLATFTENAADNMRENIIKHCNYDLSELREAPISTFHGFCQRLLLRKGFHAPQKLGIDEGITGNVQTLSNKVQEAREFHDFYDNFREDYPQHGEYYPLVYDDTNLLGLINSLAAKGIFPKREGWYRNSRNQLHGNFEKFLERSKEINSPLPGKRRKKQSRLLKKLNDMKNREFRKGEVSNKSQIKTGKQVDPAIMEEAFHEKREPLIQFVHDLYFEYIKHLLGRNYLNFSFQLMFAFVLLMEDHRLRSSQQFNYVMIDEFQDTNEIQFKLSLLLSRTGNIAVVGDWKQSIFSFQYANVQNIISFRERLEQYYQEINEDQLRTPFPLREVNTIELKQNYRSSQQILDFALQALSVRGRKNEKVQLQEEPVPLTAANEKIDTEIGAFVSENEAEAVLTRVVEVVESNQYQVNGKPLRYRDVAIFSRNRAFALELAKKAREHDLPVTYEGGAEIFKTDPGIILLAWLRVLERDDSRRGWAVLLDEAGYNLGEVEHILDNCDYPPDMLNFKDQLSKTEGVGTVARTVFSRYGYDNQFTDAIIVALEEALRSSYMNLGSAIRFIEANIELGETYEVDNVSANSATVQTIHAAKGLEYPAVFVANMNRHVFPSTSANRKRIYYSDLAGLRQKKIYSEEDDFVYDDFNGYLTSKVNSIDYDEERRLLYVALTRAENYLFLSATKEQESNFFQDLDLEPDHLRGKGEKLDTTQRSPDKRELYVSKPQEERPIKRAVHSEIELPEDIPAGGRGQEFGTKIHIYAEKLARGERPGMSFEEGERKDQRHIEKFISSLPGRLYPEQDVLIPQIQEGKKYVYHGSIDLLHVQNNRVELIDFKTDLDRSLEDQYRKQLNLYREAVAAEYPDREIVALIFYTREDELVEI